MFKQSANGVVLRLSIKNTLDISPSPGAVCWGFSLAPLWALSPPSVLHQDRGVIAADPTLP